MKLLVIRMSSLGDVILSTAFLESLPKDVEVDWIIAKEFAFVLKGHPRIHHLIEFDKKSGMKGWIQLIAKLSHQDYDARVDLHVTLRSQIARLVFHWLDLSRGIWVPWKKISKQRFHFYGYLIFKKLWPSFLRPTPLWKRFSRLAMQVSKQNHEFKHPSMLHQLPTDSTEVLKKYQLEPKKYFVVMPSSRWKSKEWGAESYAKLCADHAKKTRLIPVILGRTQDESAVSLIEQLKAQSIDHRSVLTENDFKFTGSLIQHSCFYVGSDTGLAHLAEAVGTPAFMIFGPTRPDLGFGPWSEKSGSIHSEVICSPCSKDGRTCYRFNEPYACLKKITVEQVKEHLPS
jgi:ADP-heptose:LPS heptosyltransferase